MVIKGFTSISQHTSKFYSCLHPKLHMHLATPIFPFLSGPSGQCSIDCFHKFDYVTPIREVMQCLSFCDELISCNHATAEYQDPMHPGFNNIPFCNISNALFHHVSMEVKTVSLFQTLGTILQQTQEYSLFFL